MKFEYTFNSASKGSLISSKYEINNNNNDNKVIFLSNEGKREENKKNSDNEIENEDNYDFIIEFAILTYNGYEIVIENINFNNKTCRISYLNNINNINNKYLENIPFCDIKHTLPLIKQNKTIDIKVINGEYKGLEGVLIGIDGK